MSQKDESSRAFPCCISSGSGNRGRYISGGVTQVWPACCRKAKLGGIGHRIVETPICKISIEKHKPQNVKREFAIYPDLLVPVARSRCPFPWPILWSIPVDIYMAHRPVSRVFEWLPYQHHCFIYSSRILVP